MVIVVVPGGVGRDVVVQPLDDDVEVALHPGDVGLGRLYRGLGGALSGAQVGKVVRVELLKLGELLLGVERPVKFKSGLKRSVLEVLGVQITVYLVTASTILETGEETAVSK